MLHILYLVHDLYDPAVRRRMMMLAAGGARVTLAGFRRGDKPIGKVAGVAPIDLGITADGKFLARAATLSAAAVRLRGSLRDIDAPDLIIGRNLEMLALANRAQRLFGGVPRDRLAVFGEVLDETTQRFARLMEEVEEA